MNISTAWINDYLDRPADAQEQAELLTRAGFPLEASEEVAISSGVDFRQDFEMTSNRGDCLCHVGLAREIAALSGRELKVPVGQPRATGPAASTFASVTNEEPELCPLYTARIVRGVKVGPSPQWLVERLTARGDIPRNNLVDLSNFVLFELGLPTHVFDLAKLKGPAIIIRRARSGEAMLPLGEGAAEVKLSGDDLVIADAERPVAIAGVKGGALTAVTDETTDILIEAAAFDAVTVRRTSRRLNIASDSSYRYERGVHPGVVNAAADRLTELILELCGGELCEGVLSDGKAIPPLKVVAMRTERCRMILGVEIDDEVMMQGLARLGFEPQLESGAGGGVIRCTVPVHRLDIEREVDLIEEVGRMYGHDRIPIAETLQVRVAPPQSRVMARRAVNDALVGMGFLETTTHSLISERAAQLFLEPGMTLQRVDDERARAEPVLRPSILPSLLRVLGHNRDSGVEDVTLFETAATFASRGQEHVERTQLGLVMPASSPEHAVRQMRGVIDRLVQIVLGPEVVIDAEPSEKLPWYDASAELVVAGKAMGTFGLLKREVTEQFDLDEPVFGAEFGLPELYDQYPPETEARALPSYPAIERDLSAVVDEQVLWKQVRACVAGLGLAHLEAIEFVTVFRGKPIEAGRKSLTLRLRFRASDHTLRHEDVDGQMEAAIAALREQFGAKLRS